MRLPHICWTATVPAGPEQWRRNLFDRGCVCRARTAGRAGQCWREQWHALDALLQPAAVVVAAAISVNPASAQQVGGISITHGGGNTNFAKGALSESDQSATTLGGLATGRGRVITNGSNNRSASLGALSYAGQDTTTIGGYASGRGRVYTNGGGNTDLARGFGSSATQSNLTLGGTSYGTAARSRMAATTPTWRLARSPRPIRRSPPLAAPLGVMAWTSSMAAATRMRRWASDHRLHSRSSLAVNRTWLMRLSIKRTDPAPQESGAGFGQSQCVKE
jgi:hypothetical protein